MGSATCRLSQGRGDLCKLLYQIKTKGVPVGGKLEEYFDKKSVHYSLLSEGQIMVHSHSKSEYWTHADVQGKPVIGATPWGTYFSTHVLLGVSGHEKGRNKDAVRIPPLSPAQHAPMGPAQHAPQP